MNIGFIGAGKVSGALGIHLKKRGLDIAGYSSRRIESAQYAAKRTISRAFESKEELVKSCDIVFIGVPDDSISNVAIEIAQIEGLEQGKVFIHMSGALSSDELEPLSHKGCGIYSLHPIQSFAEVDESVKMLEGAVFTLEGNGLFKDKVEIITKGMKNKVYDIKKSQKVIYHAGACVASNYLVALMDFSAGMFEEAGISRKDSLDIIGRLAEGTLSNMNGVGIAKAITGPISRGDAGTVKRHIDCLKGEKHREALEMYILMGRKTLEISRRLALKDGKKAEEIEKILKNASNAKK